MVSVTQHRAESIEPDERDGDLVHGLDVHLGRRGTRSTLTAASANHLAWRTRDLEHDVELTINLHVCQRHAFQSLGYTLEQKIDASIPDPQALERNLVDMAGKRPTSDAQHSLGARGTTAAMRTRPQIRGDRSGWGGALDDRGDVVTNAHVVAGGGPVVVSDFRGHAQRATLVGSFAPGDIAVVHAQGAALQSATFAGSGVLQVGDIVLAIGNPLGLRSSVTDGIVIAAARWSCKDRWSASPQRLRSDGAARAGSTYRSATPEAIRDSRGGWRRTGTSRTGGVRHPSGAWSGTSISSTHSATLPLIRTTAVLRGWSGIS